MGTPKFLINPYSKEEFYKCSIDITKRQWEALKRYNLRVKDCFVWGLREKLLVATGEKKTTDELIARHKAKISDLLMELDVKNKALVESRDRLNRYVQEKK